ncbi:hypothetical protein H6775_02680 [Candidatus Nomurabacteria bacterium]|nr:hypothetical protein [Candidatus Nomurabacteria bacterium]
MKIFEKYKDYSRRYHETRKTTLAISGISISFDWLMILFIVAIVGIGLMIFATKTYLSLNEEINKSVQGVVSSRTLSAGEIREVTGPLIEQKTLKVKVQSVVTPSEPIGNVEETTN